MERTFSFDIPGDSRLVNDCPRADSAIDFCHNVIDIVCVVFSLAGSETPQIPLERRKK